MELFKEILDERKKKMLINYFYIKKNNRKFADFYSKKYRNLRPETKGRTDEVICVKKIILLNLIKQLKIIVSSSF